MTHDTPAAAEEVLEFWFGTLDDSGLADPTQVGKWWRKDTAFDALIRERFGDLHARAVAGELASWCETPRGLLAVVIVIDQFSRNMFRGDAKTWAWDDQALALAERGIAAGWDEALPTDPRVFLYMPLMHSEALAVQDRCVALFEALAEQLDGPAKVRIGNNVKYAIAHRDIVARFGRFPHRNAILSRVSTAEEVAFLQEPGSSF